MTNDKHISPQELTDVLLQEEKFHIESKSELSEWEVGFLAGIAHVRNNILPKMPSVETEDDEGDTKIPRATKC